MADSWHALAQVSAGDGQRYLKRRLLRLFEASRLTHLRPRDVDLSCDGTLKVVVPHASKPDVALRVVAEAGSTARRWSRGSRSTSAPPTTPSRSRSSR